MKRLLSMVLSMVIIASCLTACEESSNNDTESSKTTKSISVIESSSTAEDSSSEKVTEATSEKTEEPTTTTEETESKADVETALPTIKEQVLWEVDGVKITATGISDNEIFGMGIDVVIENNSKKDVGISTNAVIVNGYMMSDLNSFQVTAGNKAKESIDLFAKELKSAGISHIGTIELYLHTFDPSSYDTLKESKCITIKTSDADKAETTSNIKGTTLYDKNNIKIIGQYVDENSFWGATALIYIENNTKKRITVSVDDNVAVNGIMVDGTCSQEVYPNRKSFTDISFLESELEEKGIKSIDTIELTFKIYDSETYDTIATSQKIKISAK